jgi:hypothetical protein
MFRMLPVVLVAALAGCATSLARIPEVGKQYPLRVAVIAENKDFSVKLAEVLDKSGLVLRAHNPDSEESQAEPDEEEGTEIPLLAAVEIEKKWRRNTWCYITSIPGLPFAFLSSSVILTPIFGPYGGYAWFPTNLAPVVTVEVTVTARLSLGPVASETFTESASRMTKLRRSWIQLGRIDQQWFSTVLGDAWDKDYEKDDVKWSAFFRPDEYDWSEVEAVAFHNISCRAVTWLEGIFKQVEEGW